LSYGPNQWPDSKDSCLWPTTYVPYSVFTHLNGTSVVPQPSFSSARASAWQQESGLFMERDGIEPLCPYELWVYSPA